MSYAQLIAAKLRLSKVEVLSIEHETDLTDAAIYLPKNIHISIHGKNQFSIVSVNGSTFTWSKLITNIDLLVWNAQYKLLKTK
jgi:hypothetical protein